MQGKDNSSKKLWYADSLRLFGRLSVWIAVPVVVASLVGKWLDKKYESEPWLLLVCVGFSFVFSMIVLVKETAKEFDKQDNNNDKKNNAGS